MPDELNVTLEDESPVIEVQIIGTGPVGPTGGPGPAGPDGPAGSDGVSPEVTITTIPGGHRVTITDALHPTGQTFDVMDGIGVISEPVKLALLQLASKVAYIDEHGQDYYGDLYGALYPLTAITAVYEQSGTVYTTDTLDSLKTDLTVTAVYDGGTTQTIPGSDYTLSGNLTEGTSTITVSYGGKTATFTVTVTAVPGTYTVTNTLSGCTNSNSATTATEGTAYSGTITAASGYTLTGAAVSITMGGVDITSTAYSSGTISIAAVTGDIAISVTAAAVVLSSISAVYTQSGTVYDTDSLDSLKPDLVVTATYSDSSTATVPSADYTLSGTLAAATSTITASYGGKTATFTVTVTIRTLYSLADRAFSDETIDTGVALFSEDRDWSICLDFTTTANPSRKWRFVHIFAQDESTYYLSYGKGNATAGITVARFMTPYQTFLTPTANHKHIVYTHVKDSGTMICYGYEGTGNRVKVTVSGATFTATTKNLMLGGGASDTNLPSGEFHTVKVYNYVMSADEITAFLGK